MKKPHIGKEYTENDVDIVKGTKGTTRIRSNGVALLAVVKGHTAKALKVHHKTLIFFGGTIQILRSRFSSHCDIKNRK